MKNHSDHNRTPESISVTAGNIKAPLWAGVACIVEGLVCGEREIVPGTGQGTGVKSGVL